MSERQQADNAVLVFDETMTSYNFGPSHPMSPVRIDLTIGLARELGILEGLDVVGAAAATDDDLNLIHTAQYIERVRKLSDNPTHGDPTIGLGTADNPVFARMHEASALAAGASVEAARRVWTGQAPRAVNIAGGLHHAMRDHASGFCIYNDVALAIRWLLDNGAQRVAYVDVDAHHGDGVQAMFYDDPRVLTISLHESGQVLFPGTGFPDDLGGPSAQGAAVNVALPPGTGDAGWLRAFHSTVPALVRAFDPEILVTQHGCDSHTLDPLAHLALSLDAQRASYAALHELAHEVCAGRWVATGGGGYEVVDVVPRAWAHLVAIAAHRPIEPESLLPDSWREYVLSRCGRPAPARMTDGAGVEHRSWSTGYDPADAIDRAVIATRKAVYPLHGLDPWFD